VKSDGTRNAEVIRVTGSSTSERGSSNGDERKTQDDMWRKKEWNESGLVLLGHQCVEDAWTEARIVEAEALSGERSV